MQYWNGAKVKRFHIVLLDSMAWCFTMVQCFTMVWHFTMAWCFTMVQSFTIVRCFNNDAETKAKS